MELHGTRVVVTGGASGLGRATAQGFRDAGARVCVFDLNGDTPQGIGYREVDVTDAEAARGALAASVESMGGVDVVVNCAGIVAGARTLGRDGPHDLDAFERTLRVNLTGTFNISRLAAEVMASNTPNEDGERGVIVNTASIAAFEGQRGQAAYAASKAGIAGLTLPMARDLAREGIRVMAIAPGIFRTPMMAGLPPEVQQQLAADVPFPQRLGDPKEFAALVRFIVTCPYLNGTTIRIDGALRMQ
ncbi:SDR family NAD(P)-dependent oxidoreductase [Tropicimonas sp. IMCC34043]|uniref:SDR family NAD(P)-dependent oxidoreductase n=1 Tax=Tropicimonas sp. IMCC34043 TaxID=2248760 RepID=UPI000E258917|nr:SDR family NAD(P)-dependent oxidoreductase [Tropicimonas sp. IMCC34043]